MERFITAISLLKRQGPVLFTGISECLKRLKTFCSDAEILQTTLPNKANFKEGNRIYDYNFGETQQASGMKNYLEFCI